MVSIQESYGELKRKHSEKVARELLLLCHEQSLGNISETARQMRCNWRTVMKDEENISLCVSTIGKILKRNRVKMRDRKRKQIAW